MAQVTITVVCDGGSTTKITEQSLFPIHGGAQAAVLVQEAFVRTCRALGVVEQQPEPPPPGGAADTRPASAAVAQPEPKKADEAVKPATTRKA